MRLHFKIKRKLAAALAALFCITLALGGCQSAPAWDETTDPPEAVVPVLMFHDVKSYAGGTWSMSADNFRATLVFLKDSGYTPVSFEQLAAYVDGSAGLPEKPVCVTLDDGYFSNYRNVLPMITELGVPVTVFMNCATVRAAGSTATMDEKAIEKMSLAELSVMQASPLVQIESHTYGLHGVNTTYSEAERDCILPFENESRADWQAIFDEDCKREEAVLAQAGVRHTTVLSYPSGKSHEWALEILKKRGYRASVTTDYGHRNLVVKGDPDTLFELGRMNVNDDTTHEMLLEYLERE